MTCGSNFRLKKLYLFLHIFLTFSRENSRLGTSPPMIKVYGATLIMFRVYTGCEKEIIQL
jgi:hypothetical protein